MNKMLEFLIRVAIYSLIQSIFFVTHEVIDRTEPTWLGERVFKSCWGGGLC